MNRTLVWLPKSQVWMEQMMSHNDLISLSEQGTIIRNDGASYNLSPPTAQEGLLAVECVRTAQ